MNLRISHVIVVLLVVFASQCQGKEPYVSLTDMNFAWYQQNRQSLDHILQFGTEQAAIPVVNMVCLTWKHRDGAIWIEVAPAIGNAFRYKPRLIFLWFAEYPEVYAGLLHDFPRALLTAWSGEMHEADSLEGLRNTLIDELQTYWNSEGNRQLKQRCGELIETLKNTQVRMVD